MADPKSLITEFKKSIEKLSNTTSTGFLDEIHKKVKDLINPPTELSEAVSAFQSQKEYTKNIFAILKGISDVSISGLENLKTATDIVQFYIEYTQPLEQILSQLIDRLDSKTSPQKEIISDIKTKIPEIDKVKKDISRILEKSLEEFGDKFDDLNLQTLVLSSGNILDELTRFSGDLTALENTINSLTNHLENARKFFKNFINNNGNLTGSEPNQIKTLIHNWGESVTLIETIETTNPNVQNDLSNPSNSRSAIAQSIKIHDLLETNYDYLTALVRSIDLVSAGSL
jgi:uncharacterized protein YjgD (DUF1641 family)